MTIDWDQVWKELNCWQLATPVAMSITHVTDLSKEKIQALVDKQVRDAKIVANVLEQMQDGH